MHSFARAVHTKHRDTGPIPIPQLRLLALAHPFEPIARAYSDAARTVERPSRLSTPSSAGPSAAPGRSFSSLTVEKHPGPQKRVRDGRRYLQHVLFLVPIRN
jgi:hypothetical protein